MKEDWHWISRELGLVKDHAFSLPYSYHTPCSSKRPSPNLGGMKSKAAIENSITIVITVIIIDIITIILSKMILKNNNNNSHNNSNNKNKYNKKRILGARLARLKGFGFRIQAPREEMESSASLVILKGCLEDHGT